MTTFPITIDGRRFQASLGQTVLAVARGLGLEIPTLCYLEKCGPLNSCLVCLVKIGGKLVPACGTKVQPGMVIESETEEVHEARRTALELLFSDHVGDCLSPCERLCPLRLNIPVMLRQIQAGKLDEAIVTIRGALPLPAVLGRLCHHPCEQGCRRGTWDDPAAIRDLEKFATDWDFARAASSAARPMRLEAPKRQEGVQCALAQQTILPLPEAEGRGEGEQDVQPTAATGMSEHARHVTPSLHHSITPPPPLPFAYLPPCKPSSGKSVVIIGAGPTGLTAAYDLARNGHAVTVVDRHERAGGSLRAVPEAQLPANVLDAEIALLERLGIEFKLGIELGSHVTLEGLARGFDTILLAVGALASGEGARLGVPLAAAAVKADPNTCQTPVPQVFAAGAAVRPVKQLVRAMGEGRAAAECVHRFLSGQPVRRPEKPFSSIMGRLDPGELRQFLRTASMNGTVMPCDRCAGFNRQEAATEASRCLHCDCRSSGQCALQHWAQFYGADASRFRTQRRPFEQQLQPSGEIIFEPGKCILCGICVRLTEIAGEPIGLTFTGRGFDARVSAALNHAISEGMQSVAKECVKHCPTGALAFREETDT